MRSTRDLIRELLAVQGEATVGLISGQLGMNQANIRRHLEVMRAEGLVDVRAEKHEVGRPAYVYFLTERALDLSAHYPRLVNRIVKKMAAMPEAAPMLRQVFDGVAQDVTDAYRPMVTGTTVAERVAETSVALKEEGIVDHWRKRRRRLPPDEHDAARTGRRRRSPTRRATRTTRWCRRWLGRRWSR